MLNFSSSEEYESEYDIQKQRVTYNDAIYDIPEDNEIAILVECLSEDSEFEVPSNIEFDNSTYIVSKITPNAFKNSKIKKLRFAGDTSISVLKKESIRSQELEYLRLPFQLGKLDFAWCSSTPNLKEISINENNNHFIVEDDALYDTEKTILYFVSRNKRHFTVPKTVKIIASYAMEQCRKLVKVDFEEDSILEEILPWAFAHSRIKSILLPKSLKTISYDAFFYCKRLTEVQFEDGCALKNILYGAFKDTSLKEITLPPTVAKIGASAFENCENLSSVTLLKEGSVEILKKAFQNVDKQFRLTLSNATQPFGNGTPLPGNILHTI